MAEAGYFLMQGALCLGTLYPREVDQPWFQFEFSPTAAFDSVQPFFAAELELLESPGDSHWDEWEAAYQYIEQLGLRLVPKNGGPAIEDFLLHIDGDVAWFRY